MDNLGGRAVKREEEKKAPPLGGFAPAGSRPSAAPARFAVLPPGIPIKMSRPSRPTSYSKRKISENLQKSEPSPTVAWLFEEKLAGALREIPTDVAGR